MRAWNANLWGMCTKVTKTERPIYIAFTTTNPERFDNVSTLLRFLSTGENTEYAYGHQTLV